MHAGDPIILEALETRHRVTVGPTCDLVSVDRTASDSSGFKLRLYRSMEEEEASQILMCGKACTLFHKEVRADPTPLLPVGGPTTGSSSPTLSLRRRWRRSCAATRGW